MTDTIEVVNYKGYTIEVYPYEYPPDPRTDCDNLGTIVSKNHYCEVPELKSASGSLIMKHIADMERIGAVVLPVYVYKHSGTRFSTRSFYGRLPQGHAEFDSWLDGYIYATPAKIREWYGVKRVSGKRRAKVEEALRGEIETVDQYFSGQVYGYRLLDPDGEELDSNWGYWGNYSGMVKEVKAMVNRILRKPHGLPVEELLGA